MAKEDVLAFLQNRPKEELPDVTGKTDAQLRQLSDERYPIENPNCATERAAKRRMRQAYFEKLKRLRDGETAALD